MSFGNIDVINNWKCLNFINPKNASVIVAAMKNLYASRLLSARLIEVQVSGRLFGAWQ